VFAKIFTQIFDSSIADDWQVRVVFEDLLILADASGIVDMTPESIAARTRIPIKVIRRALVELQKPDSRSRTPTEDGRRLTLLSDHRDWGWKITNYTKYREIRKEFDRKQYMRNYMKENRPSRAKVKQVKQESNPSLTEVNEVNCSPSTSSSVQDQGKGVQGEREICDKYSDARIALHLLNESSGSRFREVDTNLSLIAARLSEPEVTLDGVRTMIVRQCKKWKGTTQEDYLRPETLFGKTKFEGYYAAKDQPISTNGTPQKSILQKIDDNQQARFETFRKELE
jgi:uncharacterized phage protein (TIGR02220 family)